MVSQMGASARAFSKPAASPGPRPKLRAVPSEDPVERAADEIRQVVRAGSLALALNVGEIVFRHVYRGDVELVRRHGPKNDSFRRLTRHPGVGMSTSSLWRAVATYELSLRMPLLRKSKHLSITHVRAVLGLPPRAQERLLERAERERLPASLLEAEAASARTGQGGRPAKPRVLKALDALRRVASLPLSTFSDPAAVEKLGADDIDCAVETLRDLDERLGKLRGVLRNLGAEV